MRLVLRVCFPTPFTFSRKALEVNGRYVEGLFNYGTMLAQLGRNADAEAVFLRALEVEPGHAGAANNLAVM